MSRRLIDRQDRETSSPRHIVVRKHSEIVDKAGWCVFGYVRLFGKWFLYAQALYVTWAEVPEAIEEVWDLLP